MKKLLPLFLTLIFCLNSHFVLAWGKTGHRAIGEIASQYLRSETLKLVNDLLDNQSLALVSTYPDEVKSDRRFAQYRPWHYVNIPLDKEYEDITPVLWGDIIQAIEKCVKIVGDKTQSKEERAFHLKYLVHLIGDVHQPLHTGRFEDYGGNKITLYWFGGKTNLHKLWDNGMIDAYKMSYTELAKNSPKLTQSQIQKIQNTSVLDWTRESHKAVRGIYETTLPNSKLGYEYQYAHFDFVRMQLLKAGLRLANILNITLAK